ERAASTGVPTHPYSPAWGMGTVKATQYTGSGPFKVGFTQRITTTGAGWSPGGVETPSILQQGFGFSLLPCDNNLDALGVSEDAYIGASNPAAVKAALARSV